MKVVLTGGAGFIGSNLAHHWHERYPETELVVYDLLTYAGRRESLADLEGKSGFRFVQGDLLDLPALSREVHGADLVLHLAAESHNDRAIQDPLRFVRTNVLGTATLLEACRHGDVRRLHHVSTDEVYGSLELDDPHRFVEGSPYQPRGPYSASKAGSDHLVRAWSETYGFPVTLSNCGNNFGPYQFPEKLIPLSIIRLLRGEKVRLYGDGKHVRDWIYVLDHCEAIDLISRKGRAGSTYLVSADSQRSNREVVDLLAEYVGRGPADIEYVADRLGHDRRYALDSTRLRTELGWTPRHEFHEALRDTIRWYQSHEGWWGPLLPPGR